MSHLSRFQNVSNDKDKTIFQRTVVWLDNVQAKLPWWQKILFGFLTIALICFLAIVVFSFFWSFLSDNNEYTDGNPPNEVVVNDQSQNQTGDTENEGNKIKVMNFTGMWQSKAEEVAATSIEKFGYEIKISNSRCYNQNTTNQELKSGQILESYPQAGESVEPGGTVYLWIYVPKSACNDLPPSQGGSVD